MKSPKKAHKKGHYFYVIEGDYDLRGPFLTLDDMAESMEGEFQSFATSGDSRSYEIFKRVERVTYTVPKSIQLIISKEKLS